MTKPRHLVIVCLALLPYLTPATLHADPAAPQVDAHGDPLPHAKAIFRLGTVRYRHTETVRDAQYAPDGKTFATISYGNDIRLWDAETGKPLHDLDDVPSYSSRVTFSNDGTRFAAAGLREVRVWDTATGRSLRTYQSPQGKRDRFHAVAFLPDDQQLAALGNFGFLHVWDADTGKHVVQLDAIDRVDPEPNAGGGQQGKGKARMQRVVINSLSISPDGRVIATGGVDHKIRRWDTATWEPLPVIELGWTAVEFSFGANAQQMFVLSGKDEVLRYDLAEEPKITRTFDARIDSSDLVVSRDGSLIAVARKDGQILGWDAETGELRFDTTYPDEAREDLKRLLDKHVMAVDMNQLMNYDIDLSPDGKTIAASGGPFGRIGAHAPVFIATDTGKRVRPFEAHTWRVTGIQYTPDGRQIVTTDNAGEVRTWAADTGKPVAASLPDVEQPRPFAISLQHKLIARVIKTNLSVSEADANEPRFSKNLPTEVIHSAVFSPDGRSLAVSMATTSKIPGGRAYTAAVLDATTGETLHEFPGFHGYYQAIAFSPDGQQLAVSGQSPDQKNQRAIYIYDLAEPGRATRILDGHPGDGIFAMAFSRDGLRLAVSYNSAKIRVWDMTTDRVKHELEGARNRVNGLAFNHQGTLLASADWHGQLCLWDTSNGKHVETFTGHGGPIERVAFSPNGLTVAAGGWRSDVLVWDIRHLTKAPGFSQGVDSPTWLAFATRRGE